MYKAEELINLDIKPRINDISLLVLQEYYNRYLMSFIYKYFVAIEDDVRELQLRFDKENFCHLLGIESIAKYAVKHKDIHNYRGVNGWDNIKREKISFKQLKNLNKGQFQSVKAKFVYFYLLPILIEDPMAVLFEGKNVNPPVSIKSEILFYNKYENAVIHLGIDKGDDGVYFPRTFFVEKMGKEKVENIYTVNQKKIEVVKENRTILL